MRAMAHLHGTGTGSGWRSGAWRVALLLLWCAGAARAHEPYLLVSARDDGTFTAEAGYSDGVSVEGLRLLVRDRGSGELLSEHRLPAGGKLTLPRPARPYRVVFEGGPGHRLTKPGPEPGTEDRATSPDISRAAAPAPPAPEASTTPPSAGTPPGETLRVMLVAGILFLFGAVAFALGFGAGRRSR